MAADPADGTRHQRRARRRLGVPLRRRTIGGAWRREGGSRSWQLARSSGSTPTGATASSVPSRARMCSCTSARWRPADCRPCRRARPSSLTSSRDAKDPRPPTCDHARDRRRADAPLPPPTTKSLVRKARPYRGDKVMPETTDPTFYRSPGEAVAAPPERLAYLAAFDPAGQAKDAMAVVDCDPSSPNYGRLVGWAELPTAGNELHHFGWNACSSALCHHGHGDHGQPLERRYLIVPGIRSSRTYVLDTKPDPLAPTVVREIPAEELARKAGYSRPHTVHCGPGAIFLSALGGANGNDGPGGVALIDHDSFEVIGAWEQDRGDQFFAYDVWWHLNHDTVVTSEWATPSMIEHGLDPEDLLGRKFGHHLNFWSMSERTLTQRIDLGD